jgi:Fe-S cluster assembly iron-binding protein IscA
MMLTLTDAATEHIANLLDETDTPDDTAIRLVASEEGLAMVADNAKPEDTTFDHDGKTVLVMDQQVADALDGRTLDVAETDEGNKSLAIS